MSATITITRPTFTDLDSLAAAAFNAVAISSATVPAADASNQGVVKLAGDLAGTADLPVIGADKVTTAKILNANVTTAKIADAAVTLAKMANIATSSLLGRSTADTGVPEVLAVDPLGLAFIALTTKAAQRAAMGIDSAYLEDIVTAVNQTGTGTGDALVFNTPGAPTITLTAGKWLVIGTVAARMSDVAGACGFRFSDNAGANHFGAGVAPYLGTERSAVTVLGYKDVTSGTFDVFFHGQPVTGSTVNLGEATGISYAGHILAIKLEETG